MESYINFRDTRIYCTCKGQGKTIVLLHGFLESLDIWDDFSAFLSSDFQVISIDLPGHGKSASNEKILSMDVMADSVKAVLDYLDISSCVIIGHSMGGYATLAFAEKYPEILQGFGLFHSQAAADTEEARINRERTIKLIEDNRLGFIQQFIPDLFAPLNRDKFQTSIDLLKKQAGETNKNAIIAALSGMKERPDRTNVLEGARYPVLFILGQEDTRIPLNIVLKQATMTRRCEVHILKEVGHMGFVEDRKYTMKTIKHFAQKCINYSQD